MAMRRVIRASCVSSSSTGYLARKFHVSLPETRIGREPEGAHRGERPCCTVEPPASQVETEESVE
ncbi:hypothetical protein F2Q70_00006137 [Brassica cretica]|uniref:Uncharacterized protein n=1 Tax=Brassica cretica TaxID=69181 RepID=A0A8S9IMR2_BRACR|nr:hypothetical protein F2Q70_00006137 [Brassica cretica]